jgi:HAD superfamily hydrolase (TIGR01662 family)
MIKLIAFDLWNTLVHKGINFDTYNDLLNKKGIRISRREFINLFENSVQKKKWKSEHEAYRHFCKTLGIKATKDNIKFIEYLRDRSESSAKEFPHTISMLKKLKRQGYKTGIVSNTSIFSIKKLKKITHLLDNIDYPVFSYMTNTIKPDLKMYKKMITDSGISPSEMIMIGDNKKNDVIAPKRLGINAIHYKDYGQLKRDLKKFNINI